jgi:RHS repeat-associated protein
VKLLPSRYKYDLHGNMIQMPHLPLMQWDFKDQLQATSQQVRSDGGKPEITYFVYDASGQRVRKITERQANAGQIPTRMKERIYLGGFELYREYNGEGTTVNLERETLHIMDDQQRIALVETRTKGNDGSPRQLIRYQLGNHLGSASLELSDRGAIISYEEYYPYGSTSYQGGRSVAEVGLKRYRYTGKERDGETGLYYHGARYYAAWLGRWVSCDPAGLVDGVNLYRYSLNNPITLNDLSGTQSAKSDIDATVDKDQVYRERSQNGDLTTRRPETEYKVPEYYFAPLDVTTGTPSPSPKAKPPEPEVKPPEPKDKSLRDELAESELAQGLSGLAYGTVQSLAPGGFLAPSPLPKSKTFEYFRGAGQTATGFAQVFQGLSLAVGGGAGTAAGVAGAPLTGGLSLGVSALGVGAVAVGVAEVAQGLINVGSGIATLQHAASMSVGSSSSSNSGRPTPQDSEQQANSGTVENYQSQKSFKGGKPVPYGTKGSTRPDSFEPNNALSVEVKNYDLSKGNSSLVNNVVKQAIKRAGELPPGSRQALVIDIRGQQISDAQLKTLFQDIDGRSGGLFGGRFWAFMD